MHCGESRARNPARHCSHAMIDAPTRSVAVGNTGAGDSARADERLTARALAGCPRRAEIRMRTYAPTELQLCERRELTSAVLTGDGARGLQAAREPRVHRRSLLPENSVRS